MTDQMHQQSVEPSQDSYPARPPSLRAYAPPTLQRIDIISVLTKGDGQPLGGDGLFQGGPYS
jgi:hypothetical protein